MLSVKLSKILAEKNVPHEGGMWWWGWQDFKEATLVTQKELEEKFNKDEDWKIPAYPEITLFKYAKVLFGEEMWLNKNKVTGGATDEPKYVETLAQHHTHTLADLFSSGASAEEIEEYVLSSLKEGSDE